MFQPLQEAISVFLSYIPQLIGAIIILIIGYIITRSPRLDQAYSGQSAVFAPISSTNTNR
jgi:Mechanosensitive ion channel, conserved TM helix